LKISVADEIVATFGTLEDRESGSARGRESVDNDIFDPSGVFTRKTTITEPLAGAIPRAVGIRRWVVLEVLLH